MLTAITRAVSPSIVNCELSFIDRKPIDLATAQQQHHAYRELLAKLGACVISLPAEPDLPDSMFVEDPAIVLDELAVILPLGTETRRREAPSLAQALSKFRNSNPLLFPALSKAATFCASAANSCRPHHAQATPKGSASSPPFSRPIITKSSSYPSRAACTLNQPSPISAANTLLANRAWFDTTSLSSFDWIDVDPAELHAANALALGGTVIFPASFPRTGARIKARSFSVTPLDISELQRPNPV